MCTYNTINSHTDHFEIQKRDSEESLLTFVNLFSTFVFVTRVSVYISPATFICLGTETISLY